MKLDELAGIEYYGVPGASRDCQDAVLQILQYRRLIIQALIVSSSNTHCLLLTTDIGDLVAVKSGFSSGYGGEGPTRFSYSLQFLESHGVEIDECRVDESVIERIDRSALTIIDLEDIKSARRIRPSCWHDYIMEDHYESAHNGTLWRAFLPVVPYAIIDSRIIDLALSFWNDPDQNVINGYRRLEDVIRDRTGLDDYGTRLFSKVFSGPDSILTWENANESETVGRRNLFTGAYMAHRNPRAHRETKFSTNDALSEFLLLNLLFQLESEARED